MWRRLGHVVEMRHLFSCLVASGGQKPFLSGTLKGNSNRCDRSRGVSHSLISQRVLVRYKSRDAVGKGAQHDSPEPPISLDNGRVQAADGGASTVG